MKLLLVRHAHRNKDLGRLVDNGLSAKGHHQATALGNLWHKRLAGCNIRLLSSPKARCIETLLPLAKHLDRPIRITPLLDEQGEVPHESSRRFTLRVIRFMTWAKAQQREHTVVACSHGDWIPAFCAELVGIPYDLRKGAFVLLDVDSGTLCETGEV